VLRFLPVGFALALQLACAASSPSSDRCETVADCAAGRRCVDGRCVVVRDAGAESDVGTEDDAGMDDGGLDDAETPIDAPVDAPTPGPCGFERCAIWRLPADATVWEAYPLGGGTFAPTSAIVAAFDLETEGRAYVLTETTAHVLQLSDRRWLSGTTTATLFPEAEADVVLGAYSVPTTIANGDGIHEGVTLQSGSAAYNYQLNLETGAVRHVSTITNFSDAWDAALAPPAEDVRFIWLDVDGTRDWVSASPMDTCGIGPDEMEGYAVVGTRARSHVLEAGWCFEFVAAPVHAGFAPFTYEGAPNPSEIGATFWNQGELWAFAESIE